MSTPGGDMDARSAAGPAIRLWASASWKIGVASFLMINLFLLVVTYQMTRIPYLLYEEGVRTRGTVERKEPQNHRLITYSYQVGLRRFSGRGDDGHGNPLFDEISAGDSVVLYYWRSDPSVSILGLPHLLIHDELMTLVVGFLVFSPLAACSCRLASPGGSIVSRGTCRESGEPPQATEHDARRTCRAGTSTTKSSLASRT